MLSPKSFSIHPNFSIILPCQILNVLQYLFKYVQPPKNYSILLFFFPCGGLVFTSWLLLVAIGCSKNEKQTVRYFTSVQLISFLQQYIKRLGWVAVDWENIFFEHLICSENRRSGLE